jgi:YjbE family integral membrane protein
LIYPSPENLVALGEIIWVNALLSGDNALVIALACRNLHGRQRWIGMGLGAALAVVLRIIFTIFIVELLRIPFLKIGAGLVLLWIAIKLIADTHDNDENSVEAGETLFYAVRSVVIADVAMSIDNVLAISAIATGNITLLIIGVAISIPFVVAGASLIMNILAKFPILIWAGGALLGWVSGTMIAEEPDVEAALASVPQGDVVLGSACALLVLAVAWAMKKRRSHDAVAASNPTDKETLP